MKRVMAVLALLALEPARISAQGVRVSGSTTAQYIGLRPLQLDSVDIAQVSGAGSLRQASDGSVVACIEGQTFCHFLRSGAAVAAVPIIQDLHATAWGFATGLMAVADVRLRTYAGNGSAVWPRANDAFDALALYLELDRDAFRARLGRQWKTSGLGLYNFDGADVIVRPIPMLSIEGFAGLGLAEGLNEPRTTQAISAIEPFAPDKGNYIFGAEARFHPSPLLGFGALYQREIRTDRAALYSERIASDARARIRAAIIDASIEADLATGDLNEARVRVQAPRWRSLATTLEARHYRPFFELWTIWGAFSPVAFDEVSARLQVDRGSSQIALRAARRSYGDTGTGLAFAPLRTSGWTVAVDGSTRIRNAWSASAHYGAEVGFGAARSEGDVALRREVAEDSYIGVSATAFQSAYEFRVQDGTVIGAGADARIALFAGVHVQASINAYDNRTTARPGGMDWTQVRAMVRVDWSAGSEAGKRR